MKASLVTDALRMAIWQRRLAGVDSAFRSRLTVRQQGLPAITGKHGFIGSMSRKIVGTIVWRKVSLPA